MLKISFTCPLENGLHARPASALEQLVAEFHSKVHLINLRNQRQADARSVLAMIGTDILYQERCELHIEGEDETLVHQRLSRFINDEWALCDEPAADIAPQTLDPLPVYLAQTRAQILRGNGVSLGLTQGIAVHADTPDLWSLAEQEEAADYATCCRQIQNALQKVHHQLNEERRLAKGEAASVLEAHIKLLTDSLMKETLLAQRSARNALTMLVSALEALSVPLRESGSRYLQQRTLDLQDLALRLAAHLTAQPLIPQVALLQASIVVSSAPLTPSQFLALRGKNLQGIIMGAGGEASHTVILARSFGIPLLSVEAADIGRIRAGELLLLDTRYGVAVMSPDLQASGWYQLEMAKNQRLKAKLRPLTQRAGRTREGVPVAILANIALAAEAEAVFAAGAEGIGLFRTEMLFCERAAPPDEQEQYHQYRQVLEWANGRKVVIRTLDIGGDKPCDYLNLPQEDNPFLGWRGIRLYPAFIELFHTQIRALLRASATGPLHIMVPMVTTLEEVKWLREQFNAVQLQLKNQGIATGTWSLGIMAEVPSVVYFLAKAAAYIDFISIGSNDLAQYFLACDRGNTKVRHLYNYFDPSFLRLLKDIIEQAKRAKIAIGLCGEMGGDPAALALLLGAGLRQISLSTARIAPIKARLSQLTLGASERIFEQALGCDSADEVVVEQLQHLSADIAKPVFDPALILLESQISSKADAIKVLTDNLEIEQRTFSGAEVEKAIWQREAVFSTALGFAIALPHCKSKAVSSSSVSVMRLKTPLEWNDEVTVSLVIMLTVSEREKDDHMKIFSRLARKLMHADFRQRLMEGQAPKQLAELLELEMAG